MFKSWLLPDSLSLFLMRRIFSWYLLVAITVTAFQLYFDYLETQNDFETELYSLAKTIDHPVSTALWEFNTQVLSAETQGLLNNPKVVGIRIYDEQHKLIEKAGELPPKSEKLVQSTGIIQSENRLFALSWPIGFKDPREPTAQSGAIGNFLFL